VAVATPAPAPAAPAAPTTCAGSAQKLTRTVSGKKVAFCIDRYEFPGKGSTPQTGVTWDGAQAACKAQGKRLCTAAEWTQGCGGKYPYGATYDAAKCNTAGDDEEERPLVPTGSKGECKSGAGLYDMSGNAAEWVDEGTVHGGSSERDGETATCGRAAKRFKGAGNAFVGFRCCADVAP
jgi:formylglycine-generating enzyme required for sulfatase activity